MDFKGRNKRFPHFAVGRISSMLRQLRRGLALVLAGRPTPVMGRDSKESASELGLSWLLMSHK